MNWQPRLPQEIEAESFRRIDAQVGAHDFSPEVWPVVRRMIHTSGDLGYLQTVQVHPEAVTAVVGAEPLPRPEVTKRIWEYIKQHALQDANDKRMINADERLRAIFGKAQVSMFEMTKIISQHLK